MTAPKTLITLLTITKARVTRLEHEYRQAAARAARSQSGPAESERIIIESKLAKARSHLASLQLQLRHEARERQTNE